MTARLFLPLTLLAATLMMACPPLLDGDHVVDAGQKTDAGQKDQTDSGTPFDPVAYCSGLVSEEVEPNGDAGTATPLHLALVQDVAQGTSFPGCLPSHGNRVDEDYYVLETTGTGPGWVDVYPELIDGSGQLFASFEGNDLGDATMLLENKGDQGHFGFAALPGQRYLLSFKPNFDGPATPMQYRLGYVFFQSDDSFEPNNTVADAAPITLDTDVSGTTGCAFDSRFACQVDDDWFLVNLVAGQLDFQWKQGIEHSELIANLYKPDGTTYLSTAAFNGGPHTATLDVPASGAYYVHVFSNVSALDAQLDFEGRDVDAGYDYGRYTFHLSQ